MGDFRRRAAHLSKGLPHAPYRRVDARMPLDLHSTAPLSRSISRSGTECGLLGGPAAGTDAFPRRLCARIEPCYHAREFRGQALSICRRPARAAYGAARPAVRYPSSSSGHPRHGPHIGCGHPPHGSRAVCGHPSHEPAAPRRTRLQSPARLPSIRRPSPPLRG